MIRNVVITTAAMLFVALAAAPASAQEKPPVTPHDIAGKETCSMCHSGAMEGMPAAPASHEGLEDKACVMCHAPAG